MEAYERMVPGAAGRFLAIAEEEIAHRRALEVRQMDIAQGAAQESLRLSGRGQQFAFAIAIVGIIGTVVLGVMGAQIAGSVLGGSSLGMIIVAFLKGPGTGKKSD